MSRLIKAMSRQRRVEYLGEDDSDASQSSEISDNRSCQSSESYDSEGSYSEELACSESELEDRDSISSTEILNTQLSESNSENSYEDRGHHKKLYDNWEKNKQTRDDTEIGGASSSWSNWALENLKENSRPKPKTSKKTSLVFGSIEVCIPCQKNRIVNDKPCHKHSLPEDHSNTLKNVAGSSKQAHDTSLDSLTDDNITPKHTYTNTIIKAYNDTAFISEPSTNSNDDNVYNSQEGTSNSQNSKSLVDENTNICTSKSPISNSSAKSSIQQTSADSDHYNLHPAPSESLKCDSVTDPFTTSTKANIADMSASKDKKSSNRKANRNRVNTPKKNLSSMSAWNDFALRESLANNSIEDLSLSTTDPNQTNEEQKLNKHKTKKNSKTKRSTLKPASKKAESSLDSKEINAPSETCTTDSIQSSNNPTEHEVETTIHTECNQTQGDSMSKEALSNDELATSVCNNTNEEDNTLSEACNSKPSSKPSSTGNSQSNDIDDQTVKVNEGASVTWSTIFKQNNLHTRSPKSERSPAATRNNTPKQRYNKTDNDNASEPSVSSWNNNTVETKSGDQWPSTAWNDDSKENKNREEWGSATWDNAPIENNNTRSSVKTPWDSTPDQDSVTKEIVDNEKQHASAADDVAKNDSGIERFDVKKQVEDLKTDTTKEDELDHTETEEINELASNTWGDIFREHNASIKSLRNRRTSTSSDAASPKLNNAIVDSDDSKLDSTVKLRKTDATTSTDVNESNIAVGKDTDCGYKESPKLKEGDTVETKQQMPVDNDADINQKQTLTLDKKTKESDKNESLTSKSHEIGLNNASKKEADTTEEVQSNEGASITWSTIFKQNNLHTRSPKSERSPAATRSNTPKQRYNKTDNDNASEPSVSSWNNNTVETKSGDQWPSTSWDDNMSSSAHSVIEINDSTKAVPKVDVPSSAMPKVTSVEIESIESPPAIAIDNDTFIEADMNTVPLSLEDVPEKGLSNANTNKSANSANQIVEYIASKNEDAIVEAQSAEVEPASLSNINDKKHLTMKDDKEQHNSAPQPSVEIKTAGVPTDGTRKSNDAAPDIVSNEELSTYTWGSIFAQHSRSTGSSSKNEKEHKGTRPNSSNGSNLYPPRKGHHFSGDSKQQRDTNGGTSAYDTNETFYRKKFGQSNTKSAAETSDNWRTRSTKGQKKSDEKSPSLPDDEAPDSFVNDTSAVSNVKEFKLSSSPSIENSKTGDQSTDDFYKNLEVNHNGEVLRFPAMESPELTVSAHDDSDVKVVLNDENDPEWVENQTVFGIPAPEKAPEVQDETTVLEELRYRAPPMFSYSQPHYMPPFYTQARPMNHGYAPNVSYNMEGQSVYTMAYPLYQPPNGHMTPYDISHNYVYPGVPIRYEANGMVYYSVNSPAYPSYYYPQHYYGGHHSDEHSH